MGNCLRETVEILEPLTAYRDGGWGWEGGGLSEGLSGPRKTIIAKLLLLQDEKGEGGEVFTSITGATGGGAYLIIIIRVFIQFPLDRSTDCSVV